MSSGERRSDLLTGTFVRLMLVNFGYFLSVGVMNPILPLFVRGPLRRGDVGVGISLAAFTVTALALRQFSGRLGDSRGRQLPIRVGAIVNVISVFGFLVAHSLAVGRGVNPFGDEALDLLPDWGAGGPCVDPA